MASVLSAAVPWGDKLPAKCYAEGAHGFSLGPVPDERRPGGPSDRVGTERRAFSIRRARRLADRERTERCRSDNAPQGPHWPLLAPAAAPVVRRRGCWLPVGSPSERRRPRSGPVCPGLEIGRRHTLSRPVRPDGRRRAHGRAGCGGGRRSFDWQGGNGPGPEQKRQQYKAPDARRECCADVRAVERRKRHHVEQVDERPKIGQCEPDRMACKKTHQITDQCGKQPGSRTSCARFGFDLWILRETFQKDDCARKGDKHGGCGFQPMLPVHDDMAHLVDKDADDEACSKRPPKKTRVSSNRDQHRAERQENLAELQSNENALGFQR